MTNNEAHKGNEQDTVDMHSLAFACVVYFCCQRYGSIKGHVIGLLLSPAQPESVLYIIMLLVQ